MGFVFRIDIETEAAGIDPVLVALDAEAHARAVLVFAFIGVAAMQRDSRRPAHWLFPRDTRRRKAMPAFSATTGPSGMPLRKWPA